MLRGLIRQSFWAGAILFALQMASAHARSPKDIEQDPDAAARIFAEGQALEKRGDTEKAMGAYRRAARTGSAKAAERLGELYKKQGTYQDQLESVNWYEYARRLRKNVPQR